MQNFEEIKYKIVKEIERDLHQIDPSIDAIKCLDLYDQILRFNYTEKTVYDLSGLEEKVGNIFNKVFFENQSDSQLLFEFCKTFETFIKKLYHLLNEGNLIKPKLVVDPTQLKAVSPYLSAINKVKLKYRDKAGAEVDEELAYNDTLAIKNGDQLYFNYTEKISLDKYSALNEMELRKLIDEEGKSSHIFYFVLAYKYKNISSHQEPNLGFREAFKRFAYSLIAQLHLVHFFRRELSKCLSQFNFKQLDFDNYLYQLESKINSKKTKYVSLNLLEIRNDSKQPQQGLIEDILQQNNRIRILAPAGCGKTTTIEYLTKIKTVAFKEKKTNKLPVLVYLGNLKKNISIKESISNTLQKSNDQVNNLLKTNQLQIFLDGLNEINTGHEDKKKKINEINELLETYQSLSMIITDRFDTDSHQNKYFGDLITFEIVKLNDELIEDFVKKQVFDEKQAEKVLNSIRDKAHLLDLFKKPLFLSRAIDIVKDHGILPDGEGEIIKEFIQVVLNREKNEKADPLMSIKDFIRVFSFLAGKMYENNPATNSPIHEISMGRFLKEGSEILGLEHVDKSGYIGYLKRISLELEITVQNEELIKFFHDNYFDYFHMEWMKIESMLS